MEQTRKLWSRFCDRLKVVHSAVPLFEMSGDGFVATKEIGSGSRRSVLKRSPAMEGLVRNVTAELVRDWTAGRHDYDGLIYLIFRLAESGEVLPLYIGKAETVGKGDRNLSANILNLDRDTSKFARWGDNYAYHIGDLSAVVLPGHAPDKIRPKYRAWGNAMFQEVPSDKPRLRFPVFFWAKAWRRDDVGIWEELGPTRLTFLEYLMIGVASSAYPDTLLNREGQNRA